MGRIPTGNPKGRPKGTGRLGAEVIRLTVRIPEDLYTRLVAFAEGRSYHRGDPQLSDCTRDAIAHYLACPDKRLTRNTTTAYDNNIEQTINSTQNRRTYKQQTDNETIPNVPVGLAEPSPLVQHNEQTQKSTQSLLEPDNCSTSISRQPINRTPLARLDAEDLDAMPLEAETASATLVRQTHNSPTPVTMAPPSEDTPSVVPDPPFNARVYFLQPPGPCGHASHGAAGNLVKRTTRVCKLCEDAKAAKKKAARRPAPVTKEH